MDLDARVAVNEKQIEETRRVLFGNGQPGFIAQATSWRESLRNDLTQGLAEVKADIATVKRDHKMLIIMLVAAEAISHVLSGTGTVSLKALLEFLK